MEIFKTCVCLCGSKQPAFADPALSRAVGAGGLQRSLPASVKNLRGRRLMKALRRAAKDVRAS